MAEFGPLEDIRKQREALLSGRWTQQEPRKEGEVCQAVRVGPWNLQQRDGKHILGLVAMRAVGLAQVKLGYHVTWWKNNVEGCMLPNIAYVNDHQYSSVNEALDALDEAELILKQAGFDA